MIQTWGGGGGVKILKHYFWEIFDDLREWKRAVKIGKMSLEDWTDPNILETN